jgi:hypothetical protein
MTRPDTETRLNDALSRLLAGQPTTTDGLLNVTNLCLEAGLGRDSFYRSSNTFRQRFTDAKTNRESQEPELVSLREKIRVLKRTTKDANHDTAKRTRELEDTIRIYANHIQALTLRNHHLEAEIQRLQEQLTRYDPSVRVLRPR